MSIEEIAQVKVLMPQPFLAAVDELVRRRQTNRSELIRELLVEEMLRVSEETLRVSQIDSPAEGPPQPPGTTP